MYMYTQVNVNLSTKLSVTMVRYEASLILCAVGKQDLHGILRSVCTTLMQQGAILRKLENLGEKELPYKISSHKEVFTHGRCVRSL